MIRSIRDFGGAIQSGVGSERRKPSTIAVTRAAVARALCGL